MHRRPWGQNDITWICYWTPSASLIPNIFHLLAALLKISQTTSNCSYYLMLVRCLFLFCICLRDDKSLVLVTVIVFCFVLSENVIVWSEWQFHLITCRVDWTFKVASLIFRSARTSCTTSEDPYVRAKNLDHLYTGIHALWIIRSLIKPTRWHKGIP